MQKVRGILQSSFINIINCYFPVLKIIIVYKRCRTFSVFLVQQTIKHHSKIKYSFMRNLLKQLFIASVIDNLIDNLVFYCLELFKNINIKCDIILILLIYSLNLSYNISDILSPGILLIKPLKIYSRCNILPLFHNYKSIHLATIILNHMVDSNIASLSCNILSILLNIFDKLLILHIPFPFKFSHPCAWININILYEYKIILIHNICQ